MQAAIWIVSYFLYLPYTVIDVVYEQLGVVFPGLHPAACALMAWGFYRTLWVGSLS